MPFFLLLLGIMFLVIGVENTPSMFLALLKKDFTGAGNFSYWVIGFIAVGAIGYWDRAKPVSDALLALIIVGLLLSHGGFFGALSTGISTTNTGGATSGTLGIGVSGPVAPGGITFNI
jgi:hypothetical protein